jgi:hypothetical protein
MLLGKYVGAVATMTHTRWLPHALETLSLGFAAFVAGSRSVPMGDNGALLSELAARADRSRPRGRLKSARAAGVKDR